jgi:hypothetical protein
MESRMPSSLLARSRALPALAALMLAVQLGCTQNQPGRPASTDTVPLVFANESTTRADVWVMAPDVKGRRLGSVLPGETATLRVPQEFYTRGTVSFYATLRDNNRNPFLDRLQVTPGEQLRLRLPIDMKAIAVVR